MEVATDDISALCLGLFLSVGVPHSNAECVVEHVIESSRMGLHSHGVMRVPEYLDRIAAHSDGRSVAGGPIDGSAGATVESEHLAIALLNGNGGFGQVTGMAAVEVARRLAGVHGVAMVSAHNMSHAGRLGAYTDAMARKGLVALAFCSSTIAAHRVAPFGGRDGRLATNPISYAFPTSGGAVVADFATSASTEGAVRLQRKLGRSLPEGVLLDANGEPTVDPSALYATPPGAIRPMGGDLNGHKGFALGLLVDLMATLLAGDDVTDHSRIGNNMSLIAVAQDSTFLARADSFVNYVKSTRSLVPERPVILPGDRERKTLQEAASVSIDGVTWSDLSRLARQHGLAMPKPVNSALR